MKSPLQNELPGQSEAPADPSSLPRASEMQGTRSLWDRQMGKPRLGKDSWASQRRTGGGRPGQSSAGAQRPSHGKKHGLRRGQLVLPKGPSPLVSKGHTLHPHRDWPPVPWQLPPLPLGSHPAHGSWNCALSNPAVLQSNQGSLGSLPFLCYLGHHSETVGPGLLVVQSGPGLQAQHPAVAVHGKFGGVEALEEWGSTRPQGEAQFQETPTVLTEGVLAG